LLKTETNELRCANAGVADHYGLYILNATFTKRKTKSKHPTTRIKDMPNCNPKAVISQARKTWQAKHYVSTALQNKTKVQTNQS